MDGGFGELVRSFANRNNGVGAIHFTDGGNLNKVLAEMGKLSYSIRV
jgi:hypothetical protein